MGKELGLPQKRENLSFISTRGKSQAQCTPVIPVLSRGNRSISEGCWPDRLLNQPAPESVRDPASKNNEKSYKRRHSLLLRLHMHVYMCVHALSTSIITYEHALCTSIITYEHAHTYTTHTHRCRWRRAGEERQETRALTQVYRAGFHLEVLRKNKLYLCFFPSSLDHSHSSAYDHFLLFKAI